jgi:hypothetical protein
MRNVLSFLGAVLLTGGLVLGCGGGTTSTSDGGGVDTGSGGSDGGGADTGGGGADTGTGSDGGTDVDTGTGGSDAGTGVDAASDVDAATMADTGPTTFPDGAIMCRAGVECVGWSDALAAAASLNGAAGGTADAALANCVIQTHQSDCCGARHAYGFNHAARMQLCTAESACTMQYPTPAGCTSTAITTDTGETTMDPAAVRLRVVNPTSCMFGTCYTCQTFVCTDPSCMTAPGIMPRQCG